MLTLTDITYRIADRVILDRASARISDGEKVGLVGRNGAGKTTLFKLVNGELLVESGSVQVTRGLSVGGVAQEAPGGPTPLLDFVLAADTERTALLAEAETATDPNRIAEVQIRLADIDAHSAEARAGAILNGLGFDSRAQKRPCSDFSGGWRMRIALAAILFKAPDLLLLDEPTNYLDLEGTLWLETYLARYPHTVIVISHDRDLLNTVVSSILHLDAGKLVLYRGGYDQFERQRREKQRLQQKAQAKQDEQRKHMEAFVARFRYKASKARQAQSRLKMLEKLEPIAAIADEAMRPIGFPQPEASLAPPIIALDSVAVGYNPGQPILKRLDLRIDDDDRIALLGANGNGKSTFAKLVSGRLDPEAGILTRATKLRIGYFAQHQLDELRPSESAFQHVRARLPDQPDARVRARVDRFGLPTDRMDTPAESLSGGEKARLLLGLAALAGPNLLILDEPTNHLDVDSREALVHAINTFSGAVILISHDRHLVNACAERLWLVDKSTVKPFDGDLEDYRRLVLRKETRPRAKKEAGAANGETTGQDRRKNAAERRAEQAPLRKEIKLLERKLENLHDQLSTLDARLADPNLFAKDPDKGAQVAKERAETASALEVTEEEWLAASARLEEMAG
ncbi:MAG: ATP-binding cassette domain-containing protein [Pseudomonadota bacterium]